MEKKQNYEILCSHTEYLISPQVRLRKGDQEEEVSLWASGASPASADVRFVAPHHRPAYQHHAPEKVSVRAAASPLILCLDSRAADSHYAPTINGRFSHASKSISALLFA